MRCPLTFGRLQVRSVNQLYHPTVISSYMILQGDMSIKQTRYWGLLADYLLSQNTLVTRAFGGPFLGPPS